MSASGKRLLLRKIIRWTPDAASSSFRWLFGTWDALQELEFVPPRVEVRDFVARRFQLSFQMYLGCLPHRSTATRRGCTGHVAHPLRSIQKISARGFA